MNKILINESKCKEIKKQMTMILRRLKEIQESLLNRKSCLSSNLSKIISDLTKALEDDLYPYKSVTIEHRVRSLTKTPNGILCIKVFNALDKIHNKTPLESIMRGLMAPKQRWEVEETARENATKESKVFVKDMEFLLALTRKGRIGKSLVRKHIGFLVIKENLAEFEADEERVDQVQGEETFKQR